MAKQPFVPVSRVVRFRYLGTVQTAPFVNGFAFQYQGTPPDQGMLNGLCLTLAGLWNTHLAPVLGANVTLQGTQAWDISSTTAANGSDPTTHVGGKVIAAPLPVSAAEVISWPVSDRWRGGHFRTYIPGADYSDVQNGRTIVQSRIDALKAAFGNWRAAVNGVQVGGSNIVLGGVVYFPRGLDANHQPQVKTSGQFRNFGLPLVHTRLDTQRRRLGKEIT